MSEFPLKDSEAARIIRDELLAEMALLRQAFLTVANGIEDATEFKLAVERWLSKRQKLNDLGVGIVMGFPKNLIYEAFPLTGNPESDVFQKRSQDPAAPKEGGRPRPLSEMGNIFDEEFRKFLKDNNIKDPDKD